MTLKNGMNGVKTQKQKLLREQKNFYNLLMKTMLKFIISQTEMSPF